MKILIVNKYLYRRDGVTTVVEETAALLKAAGHSVAFFGQDHPVRFTEGFGEQTVSPVELHVEKAGLSGALRALLRLFLSVGAAGPFKKTLRDFKPDIVHMHNIYHHLGPHLVAKAHYRRIPVVMTLHDYKLFCPAYRMLRPEGDSLKPCDHCLKNGRHEVLRYRCVRGSFLFSLVCFLEALFHLRLYARISAFIAPSRFMAQTARRGGIPPEKLRLIPNPAPVLELPAADRTPNRPVFLFLGRLYPEKGAGLFLEALRKLPPHSFRAEIAGEGPEEKTLRALSERAGLPVSFRGFVSGEEKLRLLSCSSCVVMPSLWFENCPMTVLEAYRAGVPVVASRIGGLPEIVEEGRTGMLVPPGDPRALARALRTIITQPRAAARMGRLGKKKAETFYAPAAYLERLLRLYSSVKAG